MSNFRGVRLCLAITAFALIAVSSAVAQSIYGGVRGIISDAQGSLVSGAKVTLTDEATNSTRAAVTNETGEYNFASVVPSVYTVSAESPGFKRIERKGIPLATLDAAAFLVTAFGVLVTNAVAAVAAGCLIHGAHVLWHRYRSSDPRISTVPGIAAR